jgi:hypothetical protein
VKPAAIRANGKQILLRGEHLADCRDEETAYILAAILGDGTARLLPTRDAAKLDAITAILAGLIGLIVGVALGALL